ncbi:MAG: Amino acid permease [Aureobasidium pullulans]|nr:MAG: Amino acid permease [Aureobasidium pullulans]TIA48328.1 adenylate cyclase protein [Aureobasidium pullulans]
MADTTPKKSKPERLAREPDVEVSPSTVVNPTYNRGAALAWDTPDFGDYRKDLSCLESSGTVPSISRQQAPEYTPPPYGRNNRPSHLASNLFNNNSFYNSSSDDLPQMSPGFIPQNGNNLSLEWNGDDRRPSVASTTTMSSTGSSKRSITGKFHKKLQGFFGEDFDPNAPPPKDPPEQQNQRGRNPSNATQVTQTTRPGSPSASRPRTPNTSSEVTPWDFEPAPANFHTQSTQPPSAPSQQQQQQTRAQKGSVSGHHHRLRLPGHKHKTSLEDIDDGASVMNGRPGTIRKDSTLPTNSNGARPRATSPSPSMKSMMSAQQSQSEAHLGQRSPGHPSQSAKRSLFDRVTGRKKHDKTAESSLKNMPSSTGSLSITQTPTAPAGKKKGPVGPDGKPMALGLTKKEHTRIPFKGPRRAEPSAEFNKKDPNAPRPDAVRNASALWHLDTDMSQMEGIVNRSQPMTPPVTSEIFTGFPGIEPSKPAEEETGTWEVPDSWAVKRVPDSNVAALREVDEEGHVPRDEDPGPMYFMRIFRADSTFAVISAGLNTTASELIQMMAKKTFLQDELDTYQIVMRKTGSSRILAAGERPLAIQKHMLEMAGYNDKDKPEDLGREDHGYLVRFTFLPGKLSGYSSLDRDPGFNKMQKFNHIDLAGRDLVTIPIALYQKATEIITLNLSKNLSLDIPKDFIQSCSNLREIKYTSNEAWKLPASICLASRLTMLDVSNNRLEQMQHADLHKLHNLVSLKLSNNKLTSLPAYFGCYQALRSLNLASNNLDTFPDFLCELRTVVDLDISFNGISALPKIGKLVNLERLFATNNKLSGSFPETFKHLVKLTQIDIRFNALDNIDIMAQLPQLEHLLVGHNSIAAYEASFYRIKVLSLDHNPVTRFGLTSPVPTLSVLNLASAKLTQLPDDLFAKISNISKLVLDKNHFTALPSLIGKLTKLEHLSLAKNMLNNLPSDIGRLQDLKYLDIRENNLSRLPQEIWYARKLESLNIASNVLNEFPKPGAPPPSLPPSLPSEAATPVVTPGGTNTPDFDELGKLEAFQLRRPSQVGHGMLPGGSPAGRKASIASTYGAQSRHPSLAPRSSTESGLSSAAATPGPRKDSTMSNRLASTFSHTLRHLILADNRLSDDVFDELVLLPELRVLNLSYNELYDIPPRTIRRWPHLTELYLSGNDLSALPAEDFEEGSGLRVLHLNSNRFNVLPAELGKIQKLQTLDVGSNALKYNVSNWPYDWNWNWNHQLRYLNMSGNKRLEIKPNVNVVPGRETRDLTDFSTLQHLRILGLMDVTLTIPSVPDQGPDRRVRTAGSIIGTHIPYGMADTLGRHEHLSTLDMVIPSFGGVEDRLLFGMFDGHNLNTGGSKVAKFLYEKFRHHFADELAKLQEGDDSPLDALRRAYLSLNKDLATAATQALEARAHPSAALLHRGSITGLELGEDDMTSGAVATIMYLQGMELYVSNVGDAQALLIDSEGGHRIITRKHAPAEADERIRIREAGGYVSRQGKLNDALEVSRAFGFVQHLPGVIACPHTARISLKESDEIIVIASRELWDYLTMDFAVDVARSERGDLMRAAQKLRDLAIAFGATGKIMVMMIGVSDLRKRERARFRTHSMSMGPSGAPDELLTISRRPKRGRDNVGDSKLARLDQEIDPPQGEVTLVFTDIKNSTMLWESYPIAMRSAIKLHNELMRRHLRIIGGYEVKTEGDAFMVAFQTVTSALLWTFTIQSQLLEVPWPQEILNSIHGQEVLDTDGNRIFRGLSVRMGIHFGRPVCEQDPVTGRMDYFGPMVNRSARIQSVADGGQITVSSDFIAEIQRLLETHIETDRSGSTGSDDAMGDEMIGNSIRRELRSLSSQGFEVKDLGQRNLKGLENPEYIYLMYPHSLSARLVVQQQQQAQAEQVKAAAAAAPNRNVGIESAEGDAAKKSADSQLSIDTDHVWDLWNVSLRLEMLCSSLETTGLTALKAPETALLERMKQRGGEITDRFVINFVEHQISRIETCVTTLALRHMIQPFRPGILSTSKPMHEILGEVTAAMQELKRLKGDVDMNDA